MTDPVALRRNWSLWAGFLLSLIAFFSFFLFFAKFPATRNFPWPNLLLFIAAEALLAVGLIRAFRQPEVFRGKILGPVLSALSTLVLFAFIFVVFIFARQLPASPNAPRVGSKAPEFTLPDTSNNSVSLSSLLASQTGPSPTRGVLLVFYRGYW